MNRNVTVVIGLALTFAMATIATSAYAQGAVQIDSEDMYSLEGPPVPSLDDTHGGYLADDYGSPYEYGDDYGNEPGYAECGDSCGTGAGSGWFDFLDCYGVFTAPGRPRRWSFTADYLYVRSSFSDAIAYLETDDSNLPVSSTDTFRELNFRHESSYRFGFGYELSGCDEEVRFEFMQLNSYADSVVVPPDTASVFYDMPYVVAVPPGGQGLVDAWVGVKAYDLEYAKSIPWGSAVSVDGECGDYCGDGCGCCPCPVWDFTWTGGLRYAEVDWERSYVAFSPTNNITQFARPELEFSGGGPRVGLEGRRYFGQNGWFSMFLKGDVSLLLGTLNVTSERVTDPGETFESTITQATNGRQIIPVTELEAGLTAQLTSYSKLSAGYLFSGWHDLGFRDQFDFLTSLGTNYDDANILGFDGLFVNFEFAY